MGNDIGQLCFICPGGNVDARFEATKNKRCLNIVTNPNIVPHIQRWTNLVVDFSVAHKSKYSKNENANYPYNTENRCYVSSVVCRNRHTFKVAVAKVIIDLCIYNIEAGIHIKGWSGNDLIRKNLCAWHHAQIAFNGNRAYETNCNSTPKEDIDPLRCLFQNYTQKYDRKDQPRCGNTHIYNFQKE